MKKVCSNPKCDKSGQEQGVSDFYKKGDGYDSRCKKCTNKKKRLSRLKKKKSIISEFRVRLERPDNRRFVEALIPLFEEEIRSG